MLPLEWPGCVVCSIHYGLTFESRVVLLADPRQCGKTTFAKSLLDEVV
jgi:hypothetical protein